MVIACLLSVERANTEKQTRLVDVCSSVWLLVFCFHALMLRNNHGQMLRSNFDEFDNSPIPTHESALSKGSHAHEETRLRTHTYTHARARAHIQTLHKLFLGHMHAVSIADTYMHVQPNVLSIECDGRHVQATHPWGITQPSSVTRTSGHNPRVRWLLPMIDLRGIMRVSWSIFFLCCHYAYDQNIRKLYLLSCLGGWMSLGK